MNETVKRLCAEARQLSPEERAELVEDVLQSLYPPDPALDVVWLAEAKERLEAYRLGEMEARDGFQVIDELRGRA